MGHRSKGSPSGLEQSEVKAIPTGRREYDLSGQLSLMVDQVSMIDLTGLPTHQTDMFQVFY